MKVAQARSRHVMSLSNGAARAFEMPRSHNMVRTGDGATLPYFFSWIYVGKYEISTLVK
jgi:hypothetical protein